MRQLRGQVVPPVLSKKKKLSSCVKNHMSTWTFRYGSKPGTLVFAHAQSTAPWNMLVFANGVINDPYVFAHFHLSSQVNASAALDLVTHGVGCGGGGGAE